MTPKEKAKELLDKFKSIQFDYDDPISGTTEQSDMDHKNARKCVIIAVEEILSLPVYWDGLSVNGSGSDEYWIEVKEELKNL